MFRCYYRHGYWTLLDRFPLVHFEAHLSTTLQATLQFTADVFVRYHALLSTLPRTHPTDQLLCLIKRQIVHIAAFEVRRW